MRVPCVIFSLLITVLPAAAFARPTVAIIDSGIARTPELKPFVRDEYDTASRSSRPRFSPRYDHGTMVATILVRAAKQPVDIISFRIDDPRGCPPRAVPPCQPSAKPVVQAIRRATALGVDAINISLVLGDSSAIAAAVRDASRKGILVVMAAGNQGLDHPGNLKMAMAGYPNAVLVGALGPDGQPWTGTNRPDGKPAGYSYAWRPGVAVQTTLANGASALATGTSFAAPIETADLLTRSGGQTSVGDEIAIAR